MKCQDLVWFSEMTSFFFLNSPLSGQFISYRSEILNSYVPLAIFHESEGF